MLIPFFFILSVVAGSTSVVKKGPVLETEPDCRFFVDPRFESHVLSFKRFADVPPIVHRHLPSSRSDGGIFQTLFFGSKHIGFNHVILENTIESIYPDSYSFVQFLDFINQNGFILE